MDQLDKLKELKVVPDVIPENPANEVNVKFGEKLVELGETLTPAEVVEQPTEIKFESEADALYTLVLVDPDVPSRKKPSGKNYRHWVVGNIPGDKIEDGEVLTPFQAPTPPKGKIT